MTNDLKISRELAERLVLAITCTSQMRPALDELRALIASHSEEPLGVVERKVEGRRERFQKWVLAAKHPVFGFLDGHWLERGDDREGYANEYVQGLWVAFKEFASPPAPVAVVLPEYMPGDTEDSDVLTDCRNEGWNACLDKVKEMNK